MSKAYANQKGMILLDELSIYSQSLDTNELVIEYANMI